MDYTAKRFDHFTTVSLKFSECPCFFLKDCDNELYRISNFELHNKRMIDEFHPRLLFIALQGYSSLKGYEKQATLKSDQSGAAEPEWFLMLTGRKKRPQVKKRAARKGQRSSGRSGGDDR
jgi:hypothetical protein